MWTQTRTIVSALAVLGLGLGSVRNALGDSAAPERAVAHAGVDLVLDEREVIGRLAVLEPIERAAGARASAEQARGGARALWDNPSVAFQRAQLFDYETEDTLQVSQAIDFSGRRGLSIDAAAARAVAARETGRAQRLATITAARQLFFQVVYRRHRWDTVSAWRQRLGDILQTVERRAAAGDAPRYEVLRLSQQVRQADASVETERALLAAARARLGALMDGGLQPNVRLSGELLPPSPPGTTRALVGAALSRRGDFVARGQLVRAANLDAEAARRGWVPNLALMLGLKTADFGGARANGFVAGATVEVPVFDRGQARGTEAAARATEAEAVGRLARTQAQASVEGLAVSVERLREAARGLRGDSEGRLEELLAAVDAAYRGGEVGVVALIDAYRADVDSRLGLLDLEWSARSAAIALDGELGRVPQ